MPIWDAITLPAPEAARAAAARGVNLPQDYYTEFDTDEVEAPAQRAAFFLWLSDPLPCFTRTWRDDFRNGEGIEEDVAEELDGLYLEGVDKAWKVATVLRNHHRRLNPRINMVRATVSYEEQTVYVSVDKQLGKDET